MPSYILTGTPGAGKTAILRQLERYVTEAVAFRRAREDGLVVLERRFGKPSAEALEWARNLVARRLEQRDRTA